MDETGSEEDNMSRPLKITSNNREITDPKKIVLSHFANQGQTTIPELSKELNISVPKVTLLVNELIDEKYILDYGKIESSGGRRPNLYGVAPESAFFIGVDVKQNHLNIGLSDLDKNLVKVEEKLEFTLDNTQESLDQLCNSIHYFISSSGIQKDKIKGIGINLSGRINYATGNSYSYFYFEEKPLSQVVEQRIGIPVYLENDSRAMAYGEFCMGVVENEKDVLFLNLDYGIAVGVLMNGQLYYGKSGYAGEFGHMPFFDNELICRCGKKGCLETQASGWALEQRFREKLANGSSSLLTVTRKLSPASIHMEEIIDAANHDDVLAIELIAEIGEHLGRGIAALINIFNPELVVLGGAMMATGEYIWLPVKTAINKYSLSLVNNDTQIKISTMGERAGILGACLLVRNRALGLV